MEEKFMVNGFEEATEVVKSSKGKTGLILGGLALAAGAVGFIGKKLIDRKKVQEVEYELVGDQEEDSEEESEE